MIDECRDLRGARMHRQQPRHRPSRGATADTVVDAVLPGCGGDMFDPEDVHGVLWAVRTGSVEW